MSASEWATGLIERGRETGEVPIYGSAEWAELPDTDPRKVAACVRAAERWRLDGEPAVMAERLKAELAEADWMLRMRVAEASHDVSRGWETPRGPSHAELQARRAELLQMSVDEMEALRP